MRSLVRDVSSLYQRRSVSLDLDAPVEPAGLPEPLPPAVFTLPATKPVALRGDAPVFVPPAVLALADAPARLATNAAGAALLAALLSPPPSVAALLAPQGTRCADASSRDACIVRERRRGCRGGRRKPRARV